MSAIQAGIDALDKLIDVADECHRRWQAGEYPPPAHEARFRELDAAIRRGCIEAGLRAPDHAVQDRCLRLVGFIRFPFLQRLPRPTGEFREALRTLRARLKAAAKAQPNEPVRQYVTLDQIAAIISRSKRTVEKWKVRRKNRLPAPDIEGGGGKPDEWDWERVRPWLQNETDRPLPSKYPSNRVGAG